MQMSNSNIKKRFNTTGACNPACHYMVDLTERLEEIRQLIDDGAYFTITRARQYGKTTTIAELERFIKEDYIVLSMDFQMISDAKFANEHSFAVAFASYISRIVHDVVAPVKGFDHSVLQKLEASASDTQSFDLMELFAILSELCYTAEKPVVLIIDEVDSATNNQVFLDFLAQLRAYYLARSKKNIPTFQSVILASLYDVKNIRRKIRPDEEHKINSPWNIAADFDISMSLSEHGICGMLRDYEADHHTGMDAAAIAKLLYDYTSGYPFLVSRLCKLIDEKVSGSEPFPTESDAWTKDGLLEAVKMLLMEKNTLFESLMGKLTEYPELKEKIYTILFGGERLTYSPLDPSIDMAILFGFVKNKNGVLVIANRIFEILLYDYFLVAEGAQDNPISQTASQEKNQFIQNGRLDMNLLLTKFVEHFDQIYGDHPEPFSEEEGRRRFLLYLRPIINGTGNYYIEAETRNAKRMDVVVDYHGEQFIVELKIWRGDTYNKRGEEQLSEYLDYFHLKKGYMLSYNFNQNKGIGVHEIPVGDRTLIEAVV